MRPSLLTSFAASAILVVTSLAPLSAGILSPSTVPHGPAFQRGIVPLTMTRAQVAQWRASVLPQPVQQQAARYAMLPRPSLRPKSTAAVQDWIMDSGSYIWGGSQTKKAFNITTYLTDCSEPEGGIVDHARNLVVACTKSSTINIYNAGNTTGPADTVLVDTAGYVPGDAFVDNAGNHYATNFYQLLCSSTCSVYPGNVVEWNAGDASGSTPDNTISDPNMYQVYFGDVDASGNLYIDGFNYSSSPEVDEISAGPTYTNLGITLNYPGGVYVVSPNAKPKAGGAKLSVLDQGTYGLGNDALYLYNLPYAGSLLGTLNPPQNIRKECDPVAGGYVRGEKRIKVGDAGCHLVEAGIIATNTWTQSFSANFVTPVDAAHVPSDK